MKTLRTVHFRPASGDIDLYVSDAGFSSVHPIAMPELSPGMQQLTSMAMQWLASQLPQGIQELTQVILTRLADEPATWSEADMEAIPPVFPVPLSYSAAFEISVTGRGGRGEATIGIRSVPGPVTDATAQLWDSLAALIP